MASETFWNQTRKIINTCFTSFFLWSNNFFEAHMNFLRIWCFINSPFREIDVETKITLLPKVCRRNVFLIKFFKKGRK